jgi:S-adenosylmethionine synthetase
MELVVEAHVGAGPAGSPLEIVERKGIGHPDTICDALAEQMSVALCRAYVERFGFVLHHNVDKVLLCGGRARASVGGGEVTAPIEIYLSGRATREYKGVTIPVDEIVVAACHDWFAKHLPQLDVERHVALFPRIREGSSDLTALFERTARGEVPLANDTSIGVGFCPLTDLEDVVLEVEHALNSPAIRRDRPWAGPDVKVMGVRTGDRIELTVACAFVAAHVKSIEDYQEKKESLRRFAREVAARRTAHEVSVVLNAADDPERGELYLTVTGTSAESGDDGEVGRGNRASGLITPYRPMCMEAAAGKNPVSHVGKLYSLLAERIAARTAAEIDTALDVAVTLVSCIGRRITDPRAVHVKICGQTIGSTHALEPVVRAIFDDEMRALPRLRAALLDGRVRLY